MRKKYTHRRFAFETSHAAFYFFCGAAMLGPAANFYWIVALVFWVARAVAWEDER